MTCRYSGSVSLGWVAIFRIRRHAIVIDGNDTIVNDHDLMVEEQQAHDTNLLRIPWKCILQVKNVCVAIIIIHIYTRQ